MNYDNTMNGQERSKVNEINEKIKSYYDAYGKALDDACEYRSFAYGIQWDDIQEQKQLKENNIPPLIQNEISKHQKALISEFFNNVPSPQVLAKSLSTNEVILELFQQEIKDIFIEADNNNVYAEAMEDAIRTGLGGFIHVYTDYENNEDFKQTVKMKYISFTDGFFDPMATHITRKDASFCGYFSSMSRDEYRNKYGSRDENLNYKSPFQTQSINPFVGNNNNTITVSHFYERVYFTRIIHQTESGIIYDNDETIPRGEKIEKTREINDFYIKSYVFNGEKILEQKEFHNYKFNPVVYLSGYQAVINNIIKPFPFGYDVFDVQKLKNLLLSQMGCLILNMRKEVSVFDKANTPPETLDVLTNPLQMKGSLIVDSSMSNIVGQTGFMPQFRNPIGVPGDIITLYSEASQAIDATLGRYEALQGAPSNEISGKAQQLRIAQGNVSAYFYFKNAVSTLTYVCEIIAQVLPQIYVEERTLMHKNKPYTINKRDSGEDDSLNFGLVNFNDLNISIKVGASFEAQRQQYIQIMMQIMQNMQPEVQAILAPNLLKMLDLADAPDIEKKIEALVQSQNPTLYHIMQGDYQAAQQAAQMQQQNNPQAAETQMQQQELQQKQQIEQARLQLSQQELALKQRKMSLDELKTYGDYQLNAEKNDNDAKESNAKVTSTDIKSHAEIVKAMADLASKGNKTPT